MANSQKLEITWHNKDKAPIPTTRGRYGYTWGRRRTRATARPTSLSKAT